MMVVGWLVLGWWWVVGGVVVMATMLVMLVGCRITTLVITTHILSLGLSCWWLHAMILLASPVLVLNIHQYPICPYLCNYHVQPWVLTMNSIWVRLKVGHPQCQRIATIFPHFNDHKLWFTNFQDKLISQLRIPDVLVYIFSDAFPPASLGKCIWTCLLIVKE